jgi:hypothetical protein
LIQRVRTGLFCVPEGGKVEEVLRSSPGDGKE